MTAEKYLKDKNHTIEAIQCYDQNLTNGRMNIIELMEGYHQTKLNLLTIPVVSNSVICPNCGCNKIDEHNGWYSCLNRECSFGGKL